MKKWVKRILLILIVLIVAIVAVCIWYVNDYYHSEDMAVVCMSGNENVSVKEIGAGLFLDGEGTDSALIFYPGAKVEYTAYLPLFMNLTENGIDCFLVKMPGNLAILGMNKAGDIMSEYEYENWYLSGHSLGGAMAASYTAEHLDDVDGLVLLAAYPTVTLESVSLSVVSIYGSEDGVLNMEKLEEGRAYMPADYTEICIQGGNHAWFGNYGEQEGDKQASITKEEQQKQTVEAILDMSLHKK